MSRRPPADAWVWETFIADCNWDAIDDWWQESFIDHPDQKEPLRALLSRLRKIVPKITVQNGMEKTERHIRRSDDAGHWSGREKLKGAADILELGELEAAVEGHPPEASEIWRDYTAQVKDELCLYVAEPEVTNGEQELSRSAHAQDALEHLEGVEALIAIMGLEMTDDEDRRRFEETMAEVALLAFDAGRHTQEAWSKEFEQLAFVREKQYVSFSNANYERAEYLKTRKLRAKRRKNHAQEVENAYPCKSHKKSERARSIYKNWSKVGLDDDRPDRPSVGTIQNWLSN